MRSPVLFAKLSETCSRRIPVAAGGRPQKYQHAPTPRAAMLAIELIQAERGRLMIASKNKIQIRAAIQSVRETCSVLRSPDSAAPAAPPAVSTTVSVSTFLLAPHNAAPTTMPYTTYIKRVQTPVITTSTLAQQVNAAAMTATVQMALA